MYSWKPNIDLTNPNVIDHVTDFRLSRAEYNYPAGLNSTWWSVLIEIAEVSIDQFENAVSAFEKDLLIPVAYDAGDRSRLLSRQPLTIFARKALIEALNKQDNPYHVISVQLGAATPERFLTFKATPPPLTEMQVADDTVVMAVIDNGIAIAHDLLRSGPVASRVHYAAILEAEPEPDRMHSSVGRALERSEIDQLLKNCTFNHLLDEDLFYARSGEVDLIGEVLSTVSLRKSHGTHVAALAAGHLMDAKCTERPIIAAILPSRLVQDTTGLDLLPDLYLAFHMLRKQAQRFRTVQGNMAPVVFNFSYGNNGGPHDGTGLFETMFEYYFGPDSEIDDHTQKAWFVLPAGNGNLARLHAVDDGRHASDRLSLDLMVLPDDRTPTIVQAWMPTSPQEDQTDFATFYVTTPGGNERGSIRTQPGQSVSLANDKGKEIARLSYQYVSGATERGLVNLVINPTAHLDWDAVLAPAGIWTIEIDRNDNAPTEPIHIWVRRDETLPGSKSGGRQAFFDNPGYQRFDRFGAPLPIDPPDSDCPVRRSTTISGFSCGRSPIVVAAYSEKEAQLSRYSAAGPLNPRSLGPNSKRDGPDLVAKADDSNIRRGVLSAGSRSGTWVRLSGTSVAAPRVARAAADHINDYQGDGRNWSHEATSLYPFDLNDDPKRSRAGAGGIKIPVCWSD